MAENRESYRIPSNCKVLDEGMAHGTIWVVAEVSNSPLLENVNDYAGFLYFADPEHPWLENPKAMFGDATYHQDQTIGFIADDAELENPDAHWDKEMVIQEMIKMCRMAAKSMP